MARKRKSNSTAEQFMDMIIDLTDMMWQIGAIASTVFAFLGIYSLKWAVAKNNPIDPSTIEANVNLAFGWLFYGIPLMLFGIAVALAIRAINSYQNHHRF